MQSSKDTSVTKTAGGVLRRSPTPLKEPVPEEGKTEAPRIKNPGAFFVGQFVTIFSPPGHFVTEVYSQHQSKDRDSYGEFSGKLIDAYFAESGEILAGLLEYTAKGARRYFSIDLIPLNGCSISVTLEREPDDSTQSNTTIAI